MFKVFVNVNIIESLKRDMYIPLESSSSFYQDFPFTARNELKLKRIYPSHWCFVLMILTHWCFVLMNGWQVSFAWMVERTADAQGQNMSKEIKNQDGPRYKIIWKIEVKLNTTKMCASVFVSVWMYVPLCVCEFYGFVECCTVLSGM